MHDSFALVPIETPEQDSTIVREWLRSKRSQHTQRANARDTHCLTKIFLFHLRVSLFLRFCPGLSFKTASSLINSGAGDEYAFVTEKEESVS
jgi:hypothetical protein